MPHFANDALPTGATVAVPAAFLDKLHDLLLPVAAHASAAIEDRSSRDAPQQVVLSSSQFDEIKELLRPLSEAAKLIVQQFTEIHDEPPAPAVRAAVRAPEDPPSPPANHSRSESEQGSG